MLLATLLILAVTAAIFAITQIGALITLLFVIAVLVLAYKRLPLLAFSIVFTALFLAYSWFGTPAGLWKGLLLLMLIVMWLFNVRPLRKALISRPFLKAYLRMLPTMSATEREALDAGTVWWDGELFTGKPDWDRLLKTPAARMTPEEQAFLDGPTEELCAMVDDFDVTHRRADLPPEAWAYIKQQRFWAMIIPKQYGGLELGRYAQSSILIKLCSRSIVLGTTVGVPNSLGPGELLVHYGTEEQKNHYLPRLARGDEIPCFGLTSPVAGSDATSITDTGIVCRGRYEGREVVGIRLNFSKRYITLAPVATVIGLAFRMFDPEHLLGDREGHNLRTDSARHTRHCHWPPAFSAQYSVSEWTDPRAGRFRSGGFHHRWRRHGRQRLAHAGGTTLRRSLHFVTGNCHRRCDGGSLGHRRLRSYSKTIRLTGWEIRRRGASHRPHYGHDLHHGCRPISHHRRH
jgi:Acyl-CoA dehydrogenase, N-terminal domain